MFLVPDTRPKSSRRIDSLPMIHRVKTRKDYFDWTWALKKPVEIRYADRDYRVADVFHQYEIVPDGKHFNQHEQRELPFVYTGRSIVCVIRAILDNVPGLESGHIMLLLDTVSFHSND